MKVINSVLAFGAILLASCQGFQVATDANEAATISWTKSAPPNCVAACQRFTDSKFDPKKHLSRKNNLVHKVVASDGAKHAIFIHEDLILARPKVSAGGVWFYIPKTGNDVWTTVAGNAVLSGKAFTKTGMKSCAVAKPSTCVPEQLRGAPAAVSDGSIYILNSDSTIEVSAVPKTGSTFAWKKFPTGSNTFTMFAVSKKFLCGFTKAKKIICYQNNVEVKVPDLDPKYTLRKFLVLAESKLVSLVNNGKAIEFLVAGVTKKMAAFAAEAGNATQTNSTTGSDDLGAGSVSLDDFLFLDSGSVDDDDADLSITTLSAYGSSFGDLPPVVEDIGSKGDGGSGNKNGTGPGSKKDSKPVSKTNFAVQTAMSTSVALIGFVFYML